jgi:hypothetical protein
MYFALLVHRQEYFSWLLQHVSPSAITVIFKDYANLMSYIKQTFVQRYSFLLTTKLKDKGNK